MTEILNPLYSGGYVTKWAQNKPELYHLENTKLATQIYAHTTSIVVLSAVALLASRFICEQADEDLNKCSKE